MLMLNNNQPRSRNRKESLFGWNKAPQPKIIPKVINIEFVGHLVMLFLSLNVNQCNDKPIKINEAIVVIQVDILKIVIKFDHVDAFLAFGTHQVISSCI